MSAELFYHFFGNNKKERRENIDRFYLSNVTYRHIECDKSFREVYLYLKYDWSVIKHEITDLQSNGKLKIA